MKKSLLYLSTGVSFATISGVEVALLTLEKPIIRLVAPITHDFMTELTAERLKQCELGIITWSIIGKSLQLS